MLPVRLSAQASWQNCSTEYGPLPEGMELYRFEGEYEGKAFRAFYAIADLRKGTLQVTQDTTDKRRLILDSFYVRNHQPALVVNTSFFSFATNRNLNIIMNNGKILAHNEHVVKGRGAHSTVYMHPLVGALGIRRNGEMDIAWTFTDRRKRKPYAVQDNPVLVKDSFSVVDIRWARRNRRNKNLSVHMPAPSTGQSQFPRLKRWLVQTAIGGGPVLVQNNQIHITNNEEWKFAGKAINDYHPRTAVGYTSDGRLIVLVIEGRNPGVAEGATLPQTAAILQQLGCVEALNLDGGGSTCMLINGRETVRPSDHEGQRAVPAVMVWRGAR